MRFNSVRSSDYSQSARAVSKASDQIFDAAISGKPDFTKISQEAIKGRSLERRTATEAEGRVAQAGIKAAADVRRTRMKADTAEKVSDIKRPAKRMAGVVAGLGAIGQAAVMNKNLKEDKAERAELRRLDQENFNKKLEIMRNDNESLQTLLEQMKDSLKPLDTTQPPASGGSTDTTSDTSTSTSTSTSNSSSPSSSTSSSTVSGGKGWTALGSTLKFAEGTYRKGGKSYNTGYGYNMFDDLSKHPDTVFNGTSAAAGAYQFMPKTWDRVSSHLGLTDFSGQSQEKAGEQLAKWRGVDTNKLFTTRAGFKQALHQMAPEWASLPTNAGVSYYDGDGVNSAKPFEELVSFYESQVGYKLK